MFPERLKLLRKSKGLSQPAFAEAFNIASGTISMWETGRRSPDLDTIQRLAQFFDVSVDYLLGRDDDPQQSPTHGDDNRDDDVLFALFGKHGDEITDEDMEDVRLALELVKKLRRDKEGH